MPARPLCSTVIEAVAAALQKEARATNERRLLVLAGDRDSCVRGADVALDGAGIDPGETEYVGTAFDSNLEAVDPRRTESLLGTTHKAVVFDAHDGLRPNAVGQVVGSVDGGGLFVLLTPSLEEWSDRTDPADEALAAPPFDVSDVSGHFRRRFVETLSAHRGVAIVDVDARSIVDDGLTNPAPRRRPDWKPVVPTGASFPDPTYEACLTGDQVDAVRAFEALASDCHAVVVEADRGRGKSSAAGLAAGALAAGGADVLVTAPEFRATRELFARAERLLTDLGALRESAVESPPRLQSSSGGNIRFETPADAVDANADVALVDEAAALPVSILTAMLGTGRVAFTTTIHGYEGAGRGFSVRFADRLAESDLDVTRTRMDEPVRYAAGDPLEVWSFNALLLDARPPVPQLVSEATTASVTDRALTSEDLLADETLLREAFGLLVSAHYRTEPTDLARLLDAPNVRVRALLHDGHVVSVALLAREGGLSAETRSTMYEGGRVRGNMIPDVLTSQLGDESAGEPVGWRILRIATHEATRSRGLGSHLLERVRDEFGDRADWLGAGFGATPPLLSFWADNRFSTVHLSTTRNDTSGEHSAIVLAPLSETGRALHDRHAARFVDRIEGVLGDALSDLEPDVARGALRACGVDVTPDLSETDWRLVARMAYGPGLMDVDPGPFRELAVCHLIDPDDPALLTPRQERLLVRKVLEARGWTGTAEDLGYYSRSACMRATGAAFQPLVDRYGTETATRIAERFDG